MELKAIKDGKGNIVISEDSFEMLLACLDNQKFVGEPPQNGDSASVGEDYYNKTQHEIQKTIDEYNSECRKILHQKYVFETLHNGLSLCKRYEHQKDYTEWSVEDVLLVHSLFKDTERKFKEPENLISLDGTEQIMQGTEPIGKTDDGWIVCKPEPTPWLIERAIRFGYEYLTISEDGSKNRPWKKEEIEAIKKLF